MYSRCAGSVYVAACELGRVVLRRVPKVLQPFMMGIDFLPFKVELKKEEPKKGPKSK